MAESRQRIIILMGAFALCGAIFVIDLLTPPGAAVWIAYLFMPLLLFRSLGAGPVTWFASLSTPLMIVDLLVTPPASHFGTAVFNRILALIVLWLSVAFLRMHSRMRISCAESEARYDSLFNSSTDVMLIIEPHSGSIVDANPAAVSFYGYSREQLTAMDIFDINVQTQDEIRENMYRAGNGTASRFIFQHRLADGSQRSVEVSSGAIRFQGRAHLFSIITDITERRRVEQELQQAHAELEQRVAERTSELAETIRVLQMEICERERVEDALRENEDRYRSLFNNSIDGILLATPEGDVLEANPEACRILGMTEVEICGRSRQEIIDEADQQAAALLEERVRTGKARGEVTFLHKDGSRIPCELSSSLFADKDGNSRACIIFRDVSERKITESALRKSNERYMLAVQGASDSIWDWDLETNTAFVSSRWKEVLGYGENEIDNVMDEWMNLIHPDDYRTALETLNGYLEGRIPEFCLEYRLRHQDGSYRWVLTRGACFRDDDGNPHRMAGSHTDITERKLAEQQLLAETAERLRTEQDLREKERLILLQSRQAAMGEMIGNIAHQWRQPLNTLGLIIQRLLLFYNSGKLNAEFLQESTQEAMKLVYHMSRTIDDFRNFFKPDKEKISFSVHAIILQTLSLINESFKAHHIEIDADTAHDVWVSGFPNEYSQVILNILLNARDAFSEQDIDEARVVIRAFGGDGGSVVTISDNAGGIPAHIIDKIFDPYFTTKGPDKGTGIGLFMAKTIIEKNMHGRLSVRNTGNGAEFTIEV
ncbi:PAS domain-containing sensor histidine kinase [Geobacter sp. AOG2]|uniref:sensor histidine kinase n=1 Tax=Geobacter sp. AOG2 TaxID=1566347 RepID=UPI001CC78710|nr:PAS domain-containing sensor histidine kinase [Geobacter sp. AOG2]GFE60905.1 hypothetical protein AOG2_14920 [Geobacter sp. AOG2]